MKILLLGGTGYIGGEIAYVLSQQNDITLECIVRESSNIHELKHHCNALHVFPKNGINGEFLKMVLCKCNPNVIIECVKMKDLKQDIHFKNILLKCVSEYNPNILTILTTGNFSLLTADIKNTVINVNDNDKIPIRPDKYKPYKHIPNIPGRNKKSTRDCFVVDNYINNSKYNNIIFAYLCSVYGRSKFNNPGVWYNIIQQNFKLNKDDVPFKCLYTSFIHVNDVANAYYLMAKYGQFNLNSKKIRNYLIGNETISVGNLMHLIAKTNNITHFTNQYTPTNNIDTIDYDVDSAKTFLNWNTKFSIYDNTSLKNWMIPQSKL